MTRLAPLLLALTFMGCPETPPVVVDGGSGGGSGTGGGTATGGGAGGGGTVTQTPVRADVVTTSGRMQGGTFTLDAQLGGAQPSAPAQQGTTKLTPAVAP